VFSYIQASASSIRSFEQFLQNETKNNIIVGAILSKSENRISPLWGCHLKKKKNVKRKSIKSNYQKQN